MQIQISWLLQKPTDLDLHCLQNRIYLGSAGQGLPDIQIDGWTDIQMDDGLNDENIISLGHTLYAWVITMTYFVYITTE